MGWLLLLFVVLPMAELALLIEVGRCIGMAATLGIIVGTGIVGASLARQQGLGVLREVQRETAQGRLPTSSLADGVLILLAAALLLTPGILTDIAGFSCLVPRVRALVKRAALRRLGRALREGRVQVFTADPDHPWGSREEREEKVVRDIRAESDEVGR